MSIFVVSAHTFVSILCC